MKHIPVRTCIATGVKKPKSEMIRIVRLESPGGGWHVQVDPKGKLRGRGANIDSTIAAFDLAVQRKAIERALKLERGLTTQELEQLRSQVEDLLAERMFRQGQKKVVYKVTRAELEEKLWS